MIDALWILTGAPGTGKTAILDELRPSLRCVDEPARRVLIYVLDDERTISFADTVAFHAGL